MTKIVDIKAYEILDSRGNPTVKAEVILDNGKSKGASVPSGASKGTHEAIELRDNDQNRYHGMGVLKAVKVIQNLISPKLKGMDPTNQRKIDEILINLDGTENKNKLGANSILAVSLACARLGAYVSHLYLYEYIAQLYGEKVKKFHLVPMFNVINGGLHGCGKFNFQEFLLIPNQDLQFDDALRVGAEIYQSLKKMFKKNGFIYSIGDEGGFTPQFSTNEEVIEVILKAIEESNYIYGKNAYIGLDLAATSFYKNNSYELTKNGQKLTKSDYINYLVALTKKYKFVSLEDGLFEDDWDGWIDLTKQLGDKIIIIGDDLLVTNKTRLQKAIKIKVCNGIIIKPNQIGTLTETLDVIRLARSVNFKIIISHRSGETNDDFIADLAVGTAADFAKFGAPARGERVIKYNKLLWLYYKLNNNL